MLPFNKAVAGGIAAGGLTRFTDWFVAGLSNELAHSAWGAIPPDGQAWLSSGLAILIGGAIVYLIPNKAASPAATHGAEK
ncbi:MAG TPA: hypothetical protein VN821_03875 [Candidatus Udaeobacter sp.]|nr:hypothetical protein [Candidatus Udaeobacter sp.]